jgi:hypothetical protein
MAHDVLRSVAMQDVSTQVVLVKATKNAAQLSPSFSKKRLGSLGTSEAQTW